MTKIYREIINLCYHCPNCYFDSYTEQYLCDAVHDDKTASSKIICLSQDIYEYSKSKMEWDNSQKTLFPMFKDELPKNPYEIPEWCPLENYEHGFLYL